MKELFENTPKQIWFDKVVLQATRKGAFAKSGQFDFQGWTFEKHKDLALQTLPQNLRTKTKNFRTAVYDGNFEKVKSVKKNSKKKFIHFRIYNK
jgi:hypothetical protein